MLSLATPGIHKHELQQAMKTSTRALMNNLIAVLPEIEYNQESLPPYKFSKFKMTQNSRFWCSPTNRNIKHLEVQWLRNVIDNQREPYRRCGNWSIERWALSHQVQLSWTFHPFSMAQEDKLIRLHSHPLREGTSKVWKWRSFVKWSCFAAQRQLHASIPWLKFL